MLLLQSIAFFFAETLFSEDSADSLSSTSLPASVSTAGLDDQNATAAVAIDSGSNIQTHLSKIIVLSIIIVLTLVGNGFVLVSIIYR